MHGVGPTIFGRIVWVDQSQHWRKKGRICPFFYLLIRLDKYTDRITISRRLYEHDPNLPQRRYQN